MARPGQVQNRRKRALAEMEAGSAAASASASPSAAGSTSPPPASASTLPLPYDQVGLGYDYTEIDYSASASRKPKSKSKRPNRRDQDDNQGSQCLPIGQLPEDFDGIPTDGSQFLAMVVKANRDLPFVKTAPNPYEKPYTPSEPVNSAANANVNGAGPSRHPALPKGSWEVLFPIHFQGYRKLISRKLSPAQTLPYPSNYPPVPRDTKRSDWYAFINGYIVSPSKGKGKEKEKEGEKVTEAAKPPSPPVELDEEEAMNSGLLQEQPEPRAEPEEDDGDVDMAHEGVVLGKTSNGNEKRVGAVREPLVSVLQRVNSSQAVQVLAHFAFWLGELVDQLPSPVPDPDFEYDDPTHGTGTGDSHSDQVVSNAISSNYFAWIFALLAMIDQQLSSEQISVLRELARAAMRVAAYRWVTGVVSRDVGEGWRLGNAWKDKDENRSETKTIIGPQIPGEDSGSTDAVGKEEEEVDRVTEGKTAQQEDADSSKAPAKATTAPDTSIDDTLAKCWMIVHAVAAGWGQKDLLMELETLFT